MNFLSSISNAVISASSQALQSATSQIPGVSGYTLGDKVLEFQGKSIWNLYTGTKRDDQSKVSIFSFELNSPGGGGGSGVDRKQLLQLAKNSFRKLRSTRHPNVLKFLNGSESDTSIWIITEPVTPLSTVLKEGGGLSLESKVYGLLHLNTALSFLNKMEGEGGSKSSVHGGLRLENSVWVTKSGEWKLGGFELCTRLDDSQGTIWSLASNLPDSRYYASPEIRKNGWTCLKEYDASVYDSWLLHLFIYQLFNSPDGSLPTSFLSSSSSETASLPLTSRGQIPPTMFQAWKRLGSQNPVSRFKTSQFLELGNSLSEGSSGGWWTQNRLVKLSTALDNFSLSSENEQTTLIRTLKAISSSSSSSSNPQTQTQSNGTSNSQALPSGFLLYKILPSLLHTFEFSSSSPSSPNSLASSSSISSSSLLPLILSLSSQLSSPTEYSQLVIPPILRMFSLPDRSMRMALLETLDQYVDKLTTKEVCEKVWPNLVTGFGDLVPVIREVTVKSILILAPKLSDRILNNDLLRYLSKTQTDSEPGIRTNTCILLSRLSPHLSSSTRSKVLIPAFARSLRDPFVHARIAGLMSLMAGLESWEKEDLAGKVIPSVGICLVDKEKSVRDQGFKAIDMFVRKCEQLTASMPETVLAPPTSTLQSDSSSNPSTPSLVVTPNNNNSIGLATNAAGAAGVLASWAFGSVGKKLSTAELSTPIERRVSTPTLPTTTTPNPPPPLQNQSSLPGGFSFEPQIETNDTTTKEGGAVGVDWGGDLMDVNDDTEDWDEFETGQQQPTKPTTTTMIRKVDPLAARLASKSKSSPFGGAGSGGGRKIGTTGLGGSMRLGSASKSSALRVPMDMDATDSWDLDLNEDESRTTTTKSLKPKLSAMDPSLLSIASSSTPSSSASKKPINSIAKPIPSKQPPTTTTPHSRTSSTISNPPSSTNSSQPPQPQPPARTVSPAPSNPWKDEISSPPPPPPIPSFSPHAPILPETSVVVPSPPTSVASPPPPASFAESIIDSRPATPSSPALTGTGGVMTKEEKAAKMALAREERRKRMAAAKAGTR